MACGNNKLTNLQYCPDVNSLDCRGNKITSLKWCPKIVDIKSSNFMSNPISTDTFTMLVTERQTKPWDLVLALNMDEIPEYDWVVISDKPSHEVLDKLRFEHRGRLKTNKFGI